MKWENPAELALKQAPFFVRNRIKKRVEDHAQKLGKSCVSLLDIQEVKKKFLSRRGMEKEIRGFDVAACFSQGKCSHSAVSCQGLTREIEDILEKADILSFLKAHVETGLKFHHEFRVVLSDCPNACSRPQIADMGIMGAILPGISDHPCTQCRACGQACPDRAIDLDPALGSIRIHRDKCLFCGECIKACPPTPSWKNKGVFESFWADGWAATPAWALRCRASSAVTRSWTWSRRPSGFIKPDPQKAADSPMSCPLWTRLSGNISHEAL